MNPVQTCPHCKKENRVAGLHGQAESMVHPARPVKLYCGHCGKSFNVSEAAQPANAPTEAP